MNNKRKNKRYQWGNQTILSNSTQIHNTSLVIITYQYLRMPLFGVSHTYNIICHGSLETQNHITENKY